MSRSTSKLFQTKNYVNIRPLPRNSMEDVPVAEELLGSGLSEDTRRPSGPAMSQGLRVLASMTSLKFLYVGQLLEIDRSESAWRQSGRAERSSMSVLVDGKSRSAWPPIRINTLFRRSSARLRRPNRGQRPHFGRQKEDHWLSSGTSTSGRLG